MKDKLGVTLSDLKENVTNYHQVVPHSFRYRVVHRRKVRHTTDIKLIITESLTIRLQPQVFFSALLL